MVYLTSLLNPTSSYVLPQPLSVTTTNPVSSFNIASTSLTLPISGSVTIATAVTAIPTGTQYVSYTDGYQLDQTGRLRVSQIGQQWWYVSSMDKDGDIRMIESFVSPATSIYAQNYAATVMTSGSASSGSAIRTSRRRFPLRTGVSILWSGIINWDGNDAGVVKRKGWFTNYNGAFFELSGGDMNVVVRRRSPDGTLTESRVARSAFNGDKLNGSGPSGENWNLPELSAYTSNTVTPTVTAVSLTTSRVYNVKYKTTTAASASAFLAGSKVTVQGFTPVTFNGCAVVQSFDTTNSTITLTYPFNPGTYISGAETGSLIQNAFHGSYTFFFDIFGGVSNRIRFGKVTNVGEVILHTFNFDGLYGGLFINAPSMFVRKEIFNTQNVNLIPTITIFGTSLSIEAQAEENPNFTVAKNNTPVNCIQGQEVPILGVALRAGEPYQRGDIQVQAIGISDLANPSGRQGSNSVNSVLYWRLLFNPGLSGVPNSTNIGKSSRQWAYTSSTALTGVTNGGGYELLAGYANSNDTINVSTSLNFINLGSNIEYTDSDKLVLMVGVLAAGGTSTSTIIGTMNIKEVL